MPSLLQVAPFASMRLFNWRRYGIMIIFLLLCLIFSFITPWRDNFPIFLTQVNIINVIRQVSIVGIMAVGMTFVIMIGQIDLGVGSLLAVCGMLAAVLQKAGAGLLPSILVPMLAGIVTGVLVGVLVTKARVPSFVATLGVLASFRGIALLISEQPVGGIKDNFRFIGAGVLGDLALFSQIPFIKILPVPIILFIGIVTLGSIIFHRYPFGRHVSAVGGNEEAARLSGINVDRIKIMVFAISGLCAAISALILTARLRSAQPNSGEGYELDVIASVVIGGTSLYGGRGSIWGSFIGAMLIGVLSNGLNLMGVSPYLQPLIKGVVIVLAVLIDQLGSRRKS
jgi:ribose/xylose/arabinose/galactoside ABC-type transport system permease subunit